MPLPLPRKAEEIAADLLHELDRLLVAILYYDVSFTQLGYHLDPITFERFSCLLTGYIERSKTQLHTRLSQPSWGSDDYPLHVWSFHNFEILAVLFRDEVESFLAFLYHHDALISVSPILKISKSISFSVREEGSVRGDELNNNVNPSSSTKIISSTSTMQFNKDLPVLSICDDDIPPLSLYESRDDSIQHHTKDVETTNLNLNHIGLISILRGLQELGTLSKLNESSYSGVQATLNNSQLENCNINKDETGIIIAQGSPFPFPSSLFTHQSLEYLKQKMQSRFTKSHLHCLLSKILEPKVKSNTSRILGTQPVFKFDLNVYSPLKCFLKELFLKNRTANSFKPSMPSLTFMMMHEGSRVLSFSFVLPLNQLFFESRDIQGTLSPGQIIIYCDLCLTGYFGDSIYVFAFDTMSSLMTTVNFVLAEFVINDSD
ncbi:hypothetical protein Clacol_007556 [Clathrus columnatus]|uniref:Uncharacterized protein n=1 Tax=Clathrus columnatus TaxID=1419009 RepID=A0AAV5AF93_9AGAM|nr:hypothetical protein Clacol_007556 [Clathrus columnatus]